MIQLYPDQQQQVEAVRGSMVAGNKRVLMQAATGAGKTIMASYILKSAGDKGVKTWFVVPRKELLRQTSLTYDQFGLAHSFVASGHDYNRYAQHHIVSLQTLPKRIDALPKPDMVMVDECHYGAGYMDKLIEWLGDTWIIGLSATPHKHNGDGMDKWFDDLVLGTPMKELIELGRLSSYRMYAPSKPDLSGIKVTAGDYNKKMMEAWMKDHGKVLIGDAISTYKEKAAGKIGLTFCTSIEQSVRVAQSYREAGIPAAHLDGTMSKDDRFYMINKFANREVLQLCSVDIMCFGFDLAAQIGRDVTVECMSDLAPTKSLSKQLQKWGRVLRKKDEPALIFDHAGNCFEHGMPDEQRDWSLKGRDKKRRGQQAERMVDMKQCEKCYFCHDPLPKCPNCGYDYPVKPRTVKEREGELEEVERIERVKKKAKRMQVGMAKSYADLLEIAKERGYQKGWAYVMAKKKGLL